MRRRAGASVGRTVRSSRGRVVEWRDTAWLARSVVWV